MKTIPVEELENGRVYKVHARNYDLAVWVGEDERPHFLGVRFKFGSAYLSPEFHYSRPSFGTVMRMEPTAYTLDLDTYEKPLDTNVALFAKLEEIRLEVGPA